MRRVWQDGPQAAVSARERAQGSGLRRLTRSLAQASVSLSAPAGHVQALYASQRLQWSSLSGTVRKLGEAAGSSQSSKLLQT